MELRALKLPMDPRLLSELKADELTLDQLISRAAVMSGTFSGESITPKSALSSPTVFAIVNRLSSMFAQLPFTVVRDSSTVSKTRIEELRDHAVTKLINRRPNTWQTPYQFKAHMMTSLLLYGTYVGFVQRAGGDPRFVIPANMDSLQVELSSRRRIVARWTELPPANREVVATQEQLLYVTGPVSLDGVTSEPPIERCKESIALEIAAEKFGASTFGSSAVPTLVLMRKGWFGSEEAKKSFKDSWSDLFGRKRRGTAVLEGDEWQLEKVQMNNDEAQFLETRKLQRSILAGMFNVPPHMVGDLERATFSNISSQSLEVLMYTLAPWLECIEAAITASMLTEREVEADKLSVRFDTKRLLRGDVKSTAEFIAKMREWGIVNANEGRGMLDMNARDDDAGADFLTPMNFSNDDQAQDEDDDERPPSLRSVR